jgi:hypothetical protein
MNCAMVCFNKACSGRAAWVVGDNGKVHRVQANGFVAKIPQFRSPGNRPWLLINSFMNKNPGYLCDSNYSRVCRYCLLFSLLRWSFS